MITDKVGYFQEQKPARSIILKGREFIIRKLVLFISTFHINEVKFQRREALDLFYVRTAHIVILLGCFEKAIFKITRKKKPPQMWHFFKLKLVL